jgi:hypothetical protein
LKVLREATEALEKQAVEAREKFKQLGAEDPERRQVLISSATAMAEFERARAEAWSRLISTLRGAEPAHASAELVLLGRLLARTDLTAAQFSRDALNLAEKNPAAPHAADLMRDYRDNSRRRWIARVFSRKPGELFSGAEELNILAENGRVVANEQDRLRALAENSGEDATKWAQYATRLRVVLAEARGLEEMMEVAATHHTGGTQNRIRDMVKHPQKTRGKLEEVLAGGAPGKQLLEPTKEFSKGDGRTFTQAARGAAR